MIVTVDKNIDTGAFVVIDVHATKAVQIITAASKEVITEIKVDVKTGVKTTVTNNATRIIRSKVITRAVETITETRTELRTYTVESIVERQYETHIEETILFIGSNNETAQVTVNINKTTDAVV